MLSFAALYGPLNYFPATNVYSENSKCRTDWREKNGKKVSVTSRRHIFYFYLGIIHSNSPECNSFNTFPFSTFKHFFTRSTQKMIG